MPEAPDPRPASAFREQVARLLKRAERLAEEDPITNEAQVRFMLSEARIAAMLDVAAALRGE